MKLKMKIFSMILAFAMLICLLPSCAKKQEVIVSIEDKSLTVNEYELLLSRMKGTLATYGYDVTDASFWRTVISADGSTYNDYFGTAILEEGSRYIISEYLFQKNGLSLDKDSEEQINALMDKLREHAGSATALNASLKNFGVNSEMLREIYASEAKMSLLKMHLYGDKGELIPKADKDEYLKENYVAFGQIFLSTYYYLIDTDELGDEVYYTDEKHTAIAYDKTAGETQKDEFGKTRTDIFGDVAYFTYDGKVAYDKKNGVLGYVTDEDGDRVVMNYGDEKIGEIYERALQYASACEGDIDAFLEYASLYGESESNGEHNYLVCSQDHYGSMGKGYAYLDTIASAVSELDNDGCTVVKSDYGCHILFKYDFEDNIYDSEEQKDVFSDFYRGLTDRLFELECDKYESLLVFDSELLKELPTIEEVGINTLY